MSLTRNFKLRPICSGCRILISARTNKSITGYKIADDALKTVTGGKVYRWLDAYENVVGLTEVKQAQSLVTEAETSYRSIQEKRRATQQQLTSVQSKIKLVAQDIEKIQRGTDAYIELVTRENEIIKDEKKILDTLNELEELEKHHFGLLSSAVRESHEKERTRAERVKYWGLSLSVIGAIAGIVGTTVNNYFRMKQLKKIVLSSSEQTLELYKSVNEQYADLRKVLSDAKPHITIPLSTDQKHADSQSDKTGSYKDDIQEVVTLMKQQETFLKQELEAIKKLVSLKAVSTNTDGTVVYGSADLESVLKDTEKNLEWKMKIQALGIVTLVYAVGAVTVPILFKFFSGGS